MRLDQRSFIIGGIAGFSIALLAVGFVACKKGKKDGDDKRTTEENQNNPRVPGVAPQSDDELKTALATVDGVTITVGEFQERINRQSPYIRARYTSLEQKKEFLDTLIRFEVLAKAAKERGFDKDPEVVRSMKQVMIQKLMKDQFENKIKPEDITEAEMQAFYKKHESEYNKPEEVRVSAIILDNRTEAEKVAKDALGDKGSSNKGFRDLVAAHSIDETTKQRGGDLRYFSADTTEVPKEVSEAAFKLRKTGDVKGPIAAGGKFYIIKQTGKRKAVSKPFEDVKRQLQNRIYRDKRTSSQKAFIEDLKNKAQIQVFDRELNNVRIDTSQGPTAGHGQAGGAAAFPKNAKQPPRK